MDGVDVCDAGLLVERVAGAGVVVVGRLSGFAGAGGGMFAPAGRMGFLIVSGAMGLAVFGDSTGFGASAGTAGAMGFTLADAGVFGVVCGLGSVAEDVVWGVGRGAGLIVLSAAAVLGFVEEAVSGVGCWMAVAGCGGWVEEAPVAGAVGGAGVCAVCVGGTKEFPEKGSRSAGLDLMVLTAGAAPSEPVDRSPLSEPEVEREPARAV